MVVICGYIWTAYLTGDLDSYFHVANVIVEDFITDFIEFLKVNFVKIFPMLVTTLYYHLCYNKLKSWIFVILNVSCLDFYVILILTNCLSEILKICLKHRFCSLSRNKDGSIRKFNVLRSLSLLPMDALLFPGLKRPGKEKCIHWRNMELNNFNIYVYFKSSFVFTWMLAALNLKAI